MADIQSKELKIREKQEMASPAEQTPPGLVFTPAVDILFFSLIRLREKDALQNIKFT